MNTILVREATEPESRQEVRTMARLARAAGVSVCWLTFGIGKPEEFDEPTSPLIAARMMAHMMGYQASFLDDWLPPSASDFDAETLWTLIKADYQRWLISQSATERPRSKL